MPELSELLATYHVLVPRYTGGTGAYCRCGWSIHATSIRTINQALAAHQTATQKEPALYAEAARRGLTIP